MIAVKAPKIRPLPLGRALIPTKAIGQYDALRELEVVSVLNRNRCSVHSLLTENPGRKCLMAFLTHWADLGSWEYAQFLSSSLEEIQYQGVDIRCIGMGSVESGREFSKYTGMPAEALYADPTGACCDALGFEKGFGPDMDISPYLKLIAMLIGFSSKGTIQEVIRGYIGDRNRSPVFEGRTAFDVLGKGYQRPLELATRRLLNMLQILPKWKELSPVNVGLLTQQGGTLIFDGTNVVFEHRDSGILMTPKVDDLIKTIKNL